jgi:predicted metal-dependent HD superfamily phosphohydrolase
MGYQPMLVRLSMDLPQDILAHLHNLYSEPHRHYHNWRHIQSCLHEFSLVRRECQHPDDVELALYFHDAIYDPTRDDNEEASAALAVKLLSHLPPAQLDHVRSLILATRHRDAPSDADARLICDLDLSILGQPADVFDAYDAAIRREYAHVPDVDFAAGRAAVLRSFLQRPRIYHAEFFHTRYDRSARDNLRRAAERWSDRPNSRP